MKTAARLLTSACFIAPLLLAGTAHAVGFKPFTDGGNVCKTCPEPGLDEIKLSTGTVIRAKITHKNSSFYVANLHGEVRAIPVGEVSEIKWANGSEPAGLTTGGQIVLKNGIILSGDVQVDTQGKVYKVTIEGADKAVNAIFGVVAEAYIGGTKR